MPSLRPAHEVILTHGNHAVVLRASLRAASNLDNLPGGLPAILDQIAGQHYGATLAAIRATATDRLAAERLLAGLEGQPLQGFMQRAQIAILDVVAHMLPVSEDAATAHPDAPAKPWGEHFRDMFSYGTGWLGWSPETVWNASIQEITIALDAHMKRLIAMHGGAEDEDQPGQNPATSTPRSSLPRSRNKALILPSTVPAFAHCRRGNDHKPAPAPLPLWCRRPGGNHLHLPARGHPRPWSPPRRPAPHGAQARLRYKVAPATSRVPAQASVLRLLWRPRRGG